MDRDDVKFAIFIVIVISIVIATFVHLIATSENVVIIGEVTDVDFGDDWMTVIFNDNELYKISYSAPYNRDIDLTVNSKMRVEIQMLNWWFNPNTDNVWMINKITKVPE